MVHHYIKVKGDGKYYNKAPGVATRRAKTSPKNRVTKPKQPKSFISKFIVKRAPTAQSIQAQRDWKESLRKFREAEAEKAANKQADAFGCRKIVAYNNEARNYVDRQKRERQLRLLS